MAEFLKKIVKSPAFKEILRVLAALAAGYAASGCSSVGAKAPNQAQLDVYECQLAVLADAVPASVAEDLVMAARANNVQYFVKQLLALGLLIERIQALAEAFVACSPSTPEPPASVSADEDLVRT